MPAFNAGGTAASNPSLGSFVVMSAFSGPKGSPFDAQQFNPTTLVKEAAPTNLSTGALTTGIGLGATHIISPTAPQSIKDAGFTDDATPGVTLPSGVAATSSILVAIGGGKSTACVDGIAPTVPYTAGFQILGFGNGGSRDAGAGPAFTGFGAKMVTATGAVANGVAIETGFLNRSGLPMTTGQSAFGSATAASAAVA